MDSVHLYVSYEYQYFYNTGLITFLSHVLNPTFMSGGGGDGGETRSET